ncbi:CAP domain-containing protein [Yoonia sp. R2331]|uniref:CAP domain-containing protein n=1 Tax=Yoonia sp. R2331 TaxID=3237238 RepID=UPI0034E3825B
MFLRTLMIACALSLTAGAAAASNACVTPPNVNAMANEIAAGVNANRRAYGQSSLSYNRRLSQAAMKHACDMAVNGFFGHRGTDGSNSQARVRQAGYRDCLVAENLAWGYPTSQQIISGWMNSAGHRSNMLHPRAAEFGVAITQGPKGPNWVLVVARGC